VGTFAALDPKNTPYGQVGKAQMRNEKYTDRWSNALTMSCHPLKYLAVSYCFIDKCMKKVNEVV